MGCTIDAGGGNERRPITFLQSGTARFRRDPGIGYNNDRLRSFLFCFGIHHRPRREIKEYVDTAASWAEENGKAAALAAFGNASGPFVTGDVYVCAPDYPGITRALPFQPRYVGITFSSPKDAYGKPYIDIGITLAKSGGRVYPVPLPVPCR